jgi:hypothetical protein
MRRLGYTMLYCVAVPIGLVTLLAAVAAMVTGVTLGIVADCFFAGKNCARVRKR